MERKLKLRMGTGLKILRSIRMGAGMNMHTYLPDSKSYIINQCPVLPASETGYLFLVREKLSPSQTYTERELQMSVAG